MSKKIVMVGGVAGGATSAARMRRLDDEAEIVIFEKGEHISFANCALPYYIGNLVSDRGELLIMTKETMWDKYRIEVRNNSEVIEVDSKNNRVKVVSKDEGEYFEEYDELVLSPGVKPFRPDTPGIDDPKIISVRNVGDIDRIKSIVIEKTGSALIIGGGFIGIEMAENLKEIGFDVTIIEGGSHVMGNFDEDMAKYIEKELMDNGVKLILGTLVDKYYRKEEKVVAVLKDGSEHGADIVISATGVRPDTNFLRNSEVLLNEKGYIKVDENLRTNITNIWAIGDAIEVNDYVTKTKTAIALAGPANRQGRMVADNINGDDKVYEGSMGTAIIKVFNKTAASTGNNEKQLKDKGIKYNTVYATLESHATYYPGAKPMNAKIIFGEDKKILGAQIVGFDKVDKFIDVLATAIYFRGTTDDLTALDLAYAPPYSTSKSPANIMGYMAESKSLKK